MNKKIEAPETLSQYVDALGNIRDQKRLLESKEKELTEHIKKHGVAGTTIHGKFFDCDIIAATNRVINVVKAFKKLGKDKFLSIANIAIKEAAKIMSEEDIDALSDTKPGSVSVRTKARPQMRGTDIGYPNLGGQENIEI
jgi:hypothetical protein